MHTLLFQLQAVAERFTHALGDLVIAMGVGVKGDGIDFRHINFSVHHNALIGSDIDYLTDDAAAILIVLILDELALAGLPGTQLSELKRVYSKAEALMQTTRFLEEHSDWQQISVANTAIAAKKILDDQDRTQAAVCSAYAAKVYGLEVLEDNINDESGNCTRFIIVTNQKVFLKGAKKISICFEVPHESGSLYHLLSHFIYNDLNMSKIESRPIEGRSWEYRFFVDFEGNLEEPGVKNALRGLREESRSLKILGNY